jgi:hypothetical protein
VVAVYSLIPRSSVYPITASSALKLATARFAEKPSIFDAA